MIVCAQMSHLASNSAGRARSEAAVTKKGQSTYAAHPSTFRTGGVNVNQLPTLNILNQANSISQLSANNTSFDPNQLVVSSETQQVDGVITAFSGLVVQNRSVDSGSAAAAVISATSSMNGANSLRISPTLQQQQQHGVPLQVQQQLVQSNQTTGQSSNNTRTSTVSPPNVSVMAQQQETHHHHQSQMSYHHLQPLQTKPMQNGRVPATKHDNRKLFVGGLPNEVTDYTFLQLFQQYGEVVDSIVLLDRRTKRSRGFGFVTFADESVANALLNVIPGRTGTVNIFGKNCEIKASEPKTEESYHQQPHVHHHHHNVQHQPSHQWGDNNYTPHRLVFGANGAAIHPIKNQSGVTPPPPLQTPVGAEQGVGVPLYSHSTITRTTAGPILSVDGSPQEGMANVYIQNNFYTLPPGTQLSPSHPLNASPTMETLQLREEELANGGGTVTYTHQQSTLNPGASSHAPFAYPGEALQPAYPGPEVDNSVGNQI